jgi:hypothetical protein
MERMVRLKACFEFADAHECNSLLEAEASPVGCGD